MDFKPKIITFHDIYPKPRMGINSFPVEKFKKFIEQLHQKYTLVTVSEILKQPHNQSLAAITFDDGYASVYEHALPVLKSHNVPASVMLITGYIGQQNLWDPSPLSGKAVHLSESQIKELIDLGWEMAPHGHRHFAYTAYNAELIIRDIKQSRGVLTDLGIEMPGYLSLPFGLSDEKVISLLKKEFSQLLGMLELRDNPQIIPRYPVYGWASFDSLLNDLNAWPRIGKLKRVLLASVHSGARLSARWQHWFGINKNGN